MNNRRNRLGVGARPFISVCVSFLYKILFSGLDRWAAGRQRRRFLKDINTDMSSLISLHGGRVVPHEGEQLRQAFDYVAVTIQFPQIRIRLISGRHELRVDAAPIEHPEDWHELLMLWLATASQEWADAPSSLDTLEDAESYLEANWHPLVASVSAERYSITGERLRKLSGLSFAEQAKVSSLPFSEQVEYVSKLY